MKSLMQWAVVFAVLLVLAYGVDHGETKLGVPVFVWLALNLTVFLYLLARFVGRPLSAFLEARKQGIGNDLKRAEEQLVEAEQLKADVLARLEKVESEVAEIQSRSDALGREEAERIVAEGEHEAQRLLQRVTSEIAQREAETRARLAQETAALTAELAKKMLESTMTEADRAAVMRRSVQALDADREEG